MTEQSSTAPASPKLNGEGWFAKLIAFLSGKDDLIGLLGILYAAGIQFWNWPNEGEIWAALGFGGAMTLRAAIAKLCRELTSDINSAPRKRRGDTRNPAELPSIILAASLPFFSSTDARLPAAAFTRTSPAIAKGALERNAGAQITSPPRAGQGDRPETLKR